MEGVFIFDDIVGVQDYVIKDVLKKVDTDDLTKALIREDEKIRKIFYRNMALNDLQELDKKLKTIDAFTGYDKRLVQKRILKIIAEVPEYQDTRFQSGFDDIEEFEKYLLERHQPEKPYGIFDKDITMCRFFDSKNGDKVLQEIKLKNEIEKMGNIHIQNTNIQLINYSVCPKCGHIFSFKDISDYYLNPRPDPLFKNKMQQYREDTRVFCNECETYFLPALIISDGTPKSEVQFLCRIQTMNAIEAYYIKNGIKVLSQRQENIVKKEETFTTKTVQSGNASKHITFMDKLFKNNSNIPNKKINKRIISGIRNDVLIKEMEKKPTLISNLIQYTPANIVLNLIEGNNFKNGDLLFGLLQ
jgi:23S rRNA U2552 (ribose-2'-O)-methylase RlmE/FtsJ